MTPFYATTVDGDPNAVVVRAIDLRGPFTGTIAAYSADTMSTAKIGRAAVIDLPYGGQEASLVVRADRPIDGDRIHAVRGRTCAFRAGTLPSRNYEAREVQRPTLAVGDSQPVEARKLQATVRAGVREAGGGTAAAGHQRSRASCASRSRLDDHGNVRYARVVDSPSINLNPSAIYAASKSEYSRSRVPLQARFQRLSVRRGITRR